jgi:ubiquinone/menaquinone biosynthesis C-methylase UbiE
MAMTSTHPHSPPPVRLTLDTPGLAETYDRLGFRQFTHGKRLIADLKVLPGHHVLDIGCGTGLLGEYVAKQQVGPWGLVVGIDPLRDRVEVARRHLAPNFQVHVGRAEDLSAFPDERFDIVYLNSVLHWIPDQALALREAVRVLKPAGRLGICTTAKERQNDLERILAAVFGAESPLAKPVMHKLDSAGLDRLLGQAGLESTRLRIRTFADRFASVDEVMAFQIASSFGNAYAELAPDDRGRVRMALDRGLDGYRLPDGTIQLRHNSIFAVARKG